MFKTLNLTLRLPLLVAVMFIAAAAPASALVLVINTTAQTISLSGNDLFVDLTGDTEYPYWLRFRTNTNTTGSYGGAYIDAGFATVNGVGNIDDNGAVESDINIKSNGRVLDLTLAFPTDQETLEGYLIAGTPFYYGDWGTFTNYLGDGSLVNGTTLSPYMPNPEQTFPLDENPTITVQVVVPEVKSAALLLGLGAAGVLALRGRRRV